jgi:transglutaminase-like putative cysteine protease
MIAKTFDIHNTLAYTVGGPTEFFFQIEAARVPEHTILSESFNVTPFIGMPREYVPPNSHNRSLRVHAEFGTTKIEYRARVIRRFEPPDTNARELSIAELPDEVMHYLLPSRYCESDLLSGMAQRTFGRVAPGYSRVQAIVEWIQQHIVYQVGQTNATTTARDVLANRVGVCRDFAHVGITMCRALNIPARIVVGYVEFETPPPDFHALFEAHLGGQWVLFDPTGLAPVENVVRIASGADAMDVAFATIYGPARMTDIQPMIGEVAHPDQPVAQPNDVAQTKLQVAA